MFPVVVLLLLLTTRATCDLLPAASHSSATRQGHRCIHEELLSDWKDGMAVVPQQYAPDDGGNEKEEQASTARETPQEEGAVDKVRDQQHDRWSRRVDGEVRLGAVSSVANPLRVKVSHLDLWNSSSYCTQIGDVRPDFRGNRVSCSTSSEILTTEKRTLLMDEMVPAAMRMHTSRIGVRTPVVGTLQVKGEGSCRLFGIPDSWKTDGVADADLVVFVSAAKTASGTVAWATACETDQYGRPTAGVLNINPSYLQESDRSAFQRDQLVRIIAHELTHILGFNSAAFRSSYPNGTFNGNVQSRGRPMTTGLSSPAVLRAAKTFFGCSTLTAVELENEGGSGTISSHWERRVLYDDLMSGTTGRNRYSSLTLAALEDSGWYTVDYLAAEDDGWGQKMGCIFLEQRCLDNGISNFGNLFCNDTNAMSNPTAACTFDSRSMGACALRSASYNYPSYYRYFPALPNVAGSEPLMDYCPVVVPYTNGHCEDSALVADTARGSYYGAGGRCVTADHVLRDGYTTTDYPEAMCLRLRCLDGKRLQVSLDAGSTWLNCPTSGEAGRISRLPGFTGSIGCPPASAMLCGAEDVAVTTHMVPGVFTVRFGGARWAELLSSSNSASDRTELNLAVKRTVAAGASMDSSDVEIVSLEAAPPSGLVALVRVRTVTTATVSQTVSRLLTADPTELRSFYQTKTGDSAAQVGVAAVTAPSTSAPPSDGSSSSFTCGTLCLSLIASLCAVVGILVITIILVVKLRTSSAAGGVPTTVNGTAVEVRPVHVAARRPSTTIKNNNNHHPVRRDSVLHGAAAMPSPPPPPPPPPPALRRESQIAGGAFRLWRGISTANHASPVPPPAAGYSIATVSQQAAPIQRLSAAALLSVAVAANYDSNINPTTSGPLLPSLKAFTPMGLGGPPLQRYDSNSTLRSIKVSAAAAPNPLLAPPSHYRGSVKGGPDELECYELEC